MAITLSKSLPIIAQLNFSYDDAGSLIGVQAHVIVKVLEADATDPSGEVELTTFAQTRDVTAILSSTELTRITALITKIAAL